MSKTCDVCGYLLYDDNINETTGPKKFCTCNAIIIPSSAMYGWICIRCGKSYSPYTSSCNCPPPTITRSSTKSNF